MKEVKEMKYLMRKDKGKHTVVKAGSIYFIGNMLDRLLVFIMIPVFTRMLSAQDYGVVATYLSWVAIVTLIVGVSFQGCIRNAYIEFKEDIEAFMSSVLMLSFMIFIGVFLMVIFIVYGMNLEYFKTIDKRLVLICLIHSYSNFIVSYLSTYYMMTYHYIKRVVLMLVPNVLIIIGSIFLIQSILSSKLYMGRIWAYAFIYGVIGVGIFLNIMFKGRCLIRKLYWKYALRLCLPLVLHGLSLVILAQSDRIMIAYYSGTSQTAIYSLVYNFSMILTVIQTAIEGIWIPWFYEKMTEENYVVINRMASQYIWIMTIFAIGITFVAPEILRWATPKSYWGGMYMILPVVLSSYMIFLYSLPVNLEYYHKNTKIISLNTLLVALLNVVLNTLLIPRYGASIAAFTTLFCYTISFLVHYRVGKKLTKELFPGKIFWKQIVLLAIMAVINYALMEKMLWRWLIVGVLSLGYLIIFYKKYNEYRKGKSYENSSTCTNQIKQ